MAPEYQEKVDNMINRVFRDCKIMEKIAVGGFGTVYKAIDLKLEIPRAIKIFHPHLSQEKGFRKRFETEMKLLAHLDHPNIVRIISAIDEPDVSGFIMEFVEGETLSDILERRDKGLPINQAIDIFTQVARAISYAHNLKDQIIHRDLSPDNIMIRPDGMVKIMDFGIAKTIGSERVTQTGIVLGKPTYMAPEQFEGAVTIYTDQYALGVILYEMVTGRVPFEAESPIALYKLHLNEEPIPPREINPQVPPNLEKVILKALAKDEKDRFKNIDEMLDALLKEGKSGERIDTRLPTLMIKVNKAVDKEEYDKALELLQEILSYEPENKEALEKRKEVLKLQKFQKDQDLIEEWFHQAQELYKSNMKEEAKDCIIDLLKIGKQYSTTSIFKECERKLKKRMEDIYLEAQNIVKEELSQVESLIEKGKKLLEEEKFKDALKKFEKAILINPYCEEIQKLISVTQKKIKMAEAAMHYKEGIVALKNENYRKAIQCFEKVLELQPHNNEAKKHLDMAKSELEKLEKSRSEIESLYREGLEHYEKWEFTQAIKKFEKILELDENHQEARMLLNESKARAAEENKIEEIGFFYNQGLTFYKSQQWQKAITCFNRVLKYMDSHKGALEYKRLAEEKIKQQELIEEAFQEALEYFRNSQYTQALKKLEYILSIDKNHKGAKQYKTLCEELRGFENEAKFLVPDSSDENISDSTLNNEVNDETSEDKIL